jgi:chemotaxis protein methyltransferase CheR
VNPSPQLSERDFWWLQSLIYETTGIHLTPNKRGMLAGRLAKRLRALRLDHYRTYLDRVRDNADEFVQMLDAVTTNETRFFREEKQFHYLQNVLIPSWREEADAGLRPRQVRVWSAGCATGEEPYSVAMALLANLGPAWSLSIVATDLSTRALREAAAGIWPIEDAAQIPQEYLKSFMLRGCGSQIGKMKAGPELRSVITFGRLNLNDADYGFRTPFDLILCRNVLIYFGTDSRRRVLERLAGHLTPNGHLFIGHAETLNGMSLPVHAMQPTIYRRERGENL